MRKTILPWLLSVVLCLLSTACSSWNRSFNIVLDNATSNDIYEPEVISDSGQFFLRKAIKSFPLPTKGSMNAHSISIKEFPSYLIVRWKSEMDSDWIERKIGIKEKLGEKFYGITYVSILENHELRLSWRRSGKNFKAVDCGGYIFEAYYYRARPKIEKKMREWQDYLKKKKSDLAQGITEPYRTESYYDRITEAEFRCNDIFYMDEKAW